MSGSLLTAIDTVVLDMDGTLLDLYFDQRLWLELLPRRYAALRDLPLAAAEIEVRERLQAERGTLAWYCMDHWSREFGLDVPALEGELEYLIMVRPGTEAFLNHVAGRGIRSVLATNAHPTSLARKLRCTGLGRYFDDVVSAHDFGAPKEERAFWERLTARLGIEPSRALFVDDNLAVLQSAAAFGIRHVWGVRTPNSRGPAISHDGFPGVDYLSELLAV
jgi:putative hydrolase of the HAD superfamily